jgi:hypothetical protein
VNNFKVEGAPLSVRGIFIDEFIKLKPTFIVAIH